MLFALLAGLGYFIAYSIQEVLCILGLITTTAVSNPNRFVQWLYKRYDHRAWKPITFDSREARHQFTDDEQWAEFQRIVTLQMVGTAGGPSMVACGFMFMLKWWNYPDPFHLTVSVVGGLLGAMLICLSWLKGAQRAQFVATYGKRKLGRGQVLQRNMSPTRE